MPKINTMARVKDNIITQGMSGMFARQIVYRTRNGHTIACKPPVKRKKAVLTESQQSIRQKFRRASAFARWAMSDDSIQSLYSKAVRKNRTAYNLAFRDAYNAPGIVRIDTGKYKGQPGDLISVRAIDDFKVTRVRVSIYSAEGNLIEEGEAQLARHGIDWLYNAKLLNPTVSGSSVKAIAHDLPENTGSMQVTIP